MVIADASVIIALSKISRLGLLRQVVGVVIVSPVVKVEVVDKGVQISAPEVVYIQQALQERWLRVARLTVTEKELVQHLMATTRLHLGEAESLAIAKQRNLTLLVDEKEARAAGRALGIGLMGSAGLLHEGFLKRELSLDELEDAVRELATVTWLSPDIVADILARAREVQR